MIRNKPVSHIIYDKIAWKQSQYAEYTNPTSITLGESDYYSLLSEFGLVGTTGTFYGVKINRSKLPYLIRVNFPINENEKFRRHERKVKKYLAKKMGVPANSLRFH